MSRRATTANRLERKRPALVVRRRGRQGATPNNLLRDRILATIREKPGIHVRALAAELSTSRQLIDYYASGLVEARLVKVHVVGKKRCLLSQGDRSTAITVRLGALLSTASTREIIELLSRSKGIRQCEIANRLGMDRSNVRRALYRLESFGIVRVRRRGSRKLFTLKRGAERAFLRLSSP